MKMVVKTIATALLVLATTVSAASQQYSDGRPAVMLRMDAKDHGVVLRYGDGPDKCDMLGARDVWVFEDSGTYYMHYDAAGPKGWLSSLAVSKDLLTWEKKGPILDFGKPGEDDSAGACYGVTYNDGTDWHMFYLGTPKAGSPPNRVPTFPYLTMKAKASSPAGPWIKQKDVVPFRTKENTYYSLTASPGHVIKNDGEYLQFFSSTTRKLGNRCVQRTLGVARTKDLDGSWTVDPQPMLPIEEQIENSTLYYEISNKTWFLFTNHIGIDGGEYTDAIWVYWSKDLNKWDAKNKAVVLDGQNCKWSKKCIGLPSVIQVDNRLALFYDAPEGESTSHMKRHIGLAWLDLPLSVPNKNAAEPTLLSPEEVQRHWASIGKFKNPALENWREVPDPGTGVWNNLHRRQLEAQSILDLSEDELTALMPDQTPLIHHPCPVCARKTPERTQVTALTRFWRNYNFDPLKPGEIQCGECNTVFPNEQFAPEKAKFDTFVNLEGDKITVPYWEYDCKWSGKPPTRGGRFNMMGVIDSARKAWVMPRLSALAECYWLTLDEKYARRLIRVLDMYAARYPHWLLTNGEGHFYEGAEKELKGGMPGWTATRWPRRLMEDCPADLMKLFDLVASSPSMNEQVRQRIIADLFLNPLKRHEPIYKDARKDAIYGNTSHLGGIINHASVLLDPGMMHDCCKWLREMPHYASSSDGVHMQSLTYGRLFHYTFFDHVRRLEGYSDQAGFTTEDGARIDNFHVLPAMEDYFRRLSSAHRDLRLPSGGSVTYDDGGPEWGTTQWWPYEGSWKPLQRSRNVLLPGTRRAILGDGEGDRQIQVHLDFAEHGVNHGHDSGLTMQIYAFGHYLVDDIAYDKSILRRYSEMSISHPTVTIDHQNQVRSDTRGDVDFYAPLMDGVSAIRVNNERVYPGLASQYTRTLLLNSIDLDTPYVIDVFEVKGGTLHDYSLRSSSQHPSSATMSIATKAMPGLRPLLPKGEIWKDALRQRGSVGSGYGVLFDVGHAKIKKPFHVTVSVEKPWEDREGLEPAYKATPDSWAEKQPVGIRHHVAIGDGYEFFNAQSPSLKEAGFYGIKGGKTDQWPRIPHQLLRHKVKSGERSVFVVVHEPYFNAPKIASVTRLETGDDQLVALSIEMQDRTDTFLYALDGEREMKAQGISANGRMTLVSRSKGKSPRGYLVQGGKLKTDGIDLERKNAAYSGSIVRAERHWGNKGENRFLVKSTSAIPDGDALRGHWMTIYPGEHPENRRRAGFTGDKATELFTKYGNDYMVAHSQPGAKRLPGVVTAVEIDRIENTPKGTWIYVTQDHGLDQRDDGGLTEFYFPSFAYEGKATFNISTVASTHPVAMPLRPQPLVVMPSRTQDDELNLKSGIRISTFAWSKEQLASGVDHRSAETLPAEAINKENATSSEIVNAINEMELAKHLKMLPKPGTLRLQGYLKVPKDGVYTFYFGASDEFRMTLNDQVVVENFWGRAEMPEEQQVRLKAGVYAITLDCFRQTKRSIWFTADWEGPNMERRSLLPNILQRKPQG